MTRAVQRHAQKQRDDGNGQECPPVRNRRLPGHTVEQRTNKRQHKKRQNHRAAVKEVISGAQPVERVLRHRAQQIEQRRGCREVLLTAGGFVGNRSHGTCSIIQSLAMPTRTKSKPEILKHGGNEGKNRRKNLRNSGGCEALPALSCSCGIAVLLSAPHNPLISSDLSSFFPPFPPCFRISGFDFAFSFLPA